MRTRREVKDRERLHVRVTDQDGSPFRRELRNVTNGSEATSAQMVKETNTSKLFFLQDFPGFEIFSNGII